MKARLVIFLSTIAVGLGIYLLVAAVLKDKFVPQEFLEARARGAELAQNIVLLSRESLKNLGQISKYDLEGNVTGALDLISIEINKNQEIRREAIKLSSQLEKMARAIGAIKPEGARILATEAVSSEVALVSRLIVYNDFFLQLFGTLETKFQGEEPNPTNRVQQLINNINDEAKAINQFNKRFSESLAEFDKIFVPE